MADSPALPADVRLKYLNEGAANIVYHISIPPSSRECDTGLPLSSKMESAIVKGESFSYLS